jgi:hypothetical protein
MGTTRAGTGRHTERRILADTMRQDLRVRTRGTSPRQLPTNHDYAGGPSGSIREYQSDQPSSTACPGPRSGRPQSQGGDRRKVGMAY